LRVSFGSLTGVFAGPQYHRIHHSILHQHLNKNFAAMFPVWDRLFGTQYLPASNEFPPTGIVGVEHTDLGGTLLSPFREWASFLTSNAPKSKLPQSDRPK
ncbi:MAG: sterol desaturase family protein, partial [Betaproteobacteria bacterium]|nr:sterol desaturase family protein [Betaproteobacteria bacterium]